MKKVFIFVVILLWGLSSVASGVKLDSLSVKVTGYTIASYGNGSGTFEIEQTRICFKGNYDKTGFTLEINPISSNLLNKAFLTYTLPLGFSLNAGLQGTAMIAHLPPPSQSPTAETPLANLPPNFNDIGVNLKYVNKLLNSSLGIFNGTGFSKKDDNRSKDFIGRLELTPIKNLLFGITYQNGQQVKGERTVYLINGQWKPISSVELNGAYLKRTDLKEDGWFANSLINCSAKVQIVAHYLNSSTGKEITSGLNFFPNKFSKIQFSCVLGEKTKPRLWFKVQQSF